jgi:hypothetical protein
VRTSAKFKFNYRTDDIVVTQYNSKLVSDASTRDAYKTTPGGTSYETPQRPPRPNIKTPEKNREIKKDVPNRK